MDLYKLCERAFEVLNLQHLSFEDIVLTYDSTLHSLFNDNIYTRGRYYVADYFALFIVKHVSNVNKHLLRRALREKLEKKWYSSSNL